jgi:predicted Zn-dependent peptidase
VVAAAAAGAGAAAVAAAARAANRVQPTVIARTQLDSGLRVVTESRPELRSVTIGAWVGSGARDETDHDWGASHFLEHLLFKGTADRSALEIAETIEARGGEMNAFTTHEQTVFYVRVPAVQLDEAFGVLTDVLWKPAFRTDDIESERRVILEEIGMRDDTPDDLVHDLFANAIFPEHPLGREVLGSESSITAMERADIAAYHDAHYMPSNVVLAAAGNLTHEELLALVVDRFPDANGSRPERTRGVLGAQQATAVMERDSEQAHVVVGMRSLAALDPDRYAFTVVNQVLGGGMSSRLFQEIREKRGLAYSVYSYSAPFQDGGYFGVYVGTAPERVHESIDVINAEVQRLVDDGLSHDEIDRAKSHLVGSLAMSLETSAARMRRLGRAEMVEGDVPSLDDLVARIERVQRDDVASVIDRVFNDTQRTIAAVGPVTL